MSAKEAQEPLNEGWNGEGGGVEEVEEEVV